MAAASRYSRQTTQTPDPERDPDSYLEAVEEAIARRSIDVLVATTDVSLSTLRDLQRRLPELTIPGSGQDAYVRLSDKYLLTEVAPKLGIAVPEQLVLREPGEVDADSLHGLGLPWF